MLTGEGQLHQTEAPLLHVPTQRRSLCTTDLSTISLQPSRRTCSEPWHAWNDFYFESQTQARCGQHTLNNLVGGPQFQHEDLVAASLQVWSVTGESPSDYVHSSDWYSHSVLATAIQNTMPPYWRWLLRPLLSSDVFVFTHISTVIKALANIENVHWVATVKYSAVLWLVDNQKQPICRSDEALLEISIATHIHTLWWRTIMTARF